jgi:hypothetical protein
MVALPSWASHLEHKLAPPPLLLVQAFVNTLDLAWAQTCSPGLRKHTGGWPTPA